MVVSPITQQPRTMQSEEVTGRGLVMVCISLQVCIGPYVVYNLAIPDRYSVPQFLHLLSEVKSGS